MNMPLKENDLISFGFDIQNLSENNAFIYKLIRQFVTEECMDMSNGDDKLNAINDDDNSSTLDKSNNSNDFHQINVTSTNSSENPNPNDLNTISSQTTIISSGCEIESMLRDINGSEMSMAKKSRLDVESARHKKDRELFHNLNTPFNSEPIQKLQHCEKSELKEQPSIESNKTLNLPQPITFQSNVIEKIAKTKVKCTFKSRNLMLVADLLANSS